MRGVPSGTEINLPDIRIVDSILVLRKLKDAGKLLHQQYTDFTHMLPNAVYSSYCKSGHHNPIFLWGKVHWDPLQVNLEHQLEECPLQIRKIFSWEHSSLKASQSMSWEYSSKLHCFQSQSCPVLPMNQWVKLKGLKPTIGSQASPYSSRPNSLLERYICQGWQKLWSLPHDTFKHFIPSANIKPCEFSAAPCRVIQVWCYFTTGPDKSTMK
jgi:hypothetical protein